MLFLNILLLFEKSDIDITSFKIRAPVYLTVSFPKLVLNFGVCNLNLCLVSYL